MAKVTDTDVHEFWSSDVMQELREDLKSGKKSDWCTHCYKLEDSYGRSPRTDALRDYKLYTPAHYQKLLEHYGWDNITYPTRLEFHVSNLCNLKCLTCRPMDSSALLTEDKILGISSLKQSDYSFTDDWIKQQLEESLKENLSILDLRGGETMMVPAIKQVLLETPTELVSELKLRVQTNCTILDDAWKQIFSKFKQIEMMLSIDAYGSLNDYIRYPSRWDNIVENVRYFKQQPNMKCHINCTVSNLNFTQLDKLIDWANSENVYLHLSVLQNPELYHFTNLPMELFNEAKQRLEKLTDSNQYVSGLLAQTPNTEHWGKFCKMISIRDAHRKNSIFDNLKEFKQFWV